MSFFLCHYFFFVFAGAPVIVGMSINIASIDSISEVNMVSENIFFYFTCSKHIIPHWLPIHRKWQKLFCSVVTHLVCISGQLFSKPHFGFHNKLNINNVLFFFLLEYNLLAALGKKYSFPLAQALEHSQYRVRSEEGNMAGVWMMTSFCLLALSLLYSAWYSHSQCSSLLPHGFLCVLGSITLLFFCLAFASWEIKCLSAYLNLQPCLFYV